MNIIRKWYVLRAPLLPGCPPIRLPRMELVTVYPVDVAAEIEKWKGLSKGLDYRVEVVLTTEKEKAQMKRREAAEQRRVNAHAEAVRARVWRAR